ncbi:MAG: phosphoadenosine phosphosulfate reductase family protein [FCB group bacterium]|nr:phosphoadenosine phosphosulfate reductase family protein [FCB group bacterium]
MTISYAQLKIRQAYDLDMKITMSQQKIREWYNYWCGQVYVSFSGGKDSTVLLHLVRELYPDVPAVFVDTGLEYPEIRDFVKTFDNVTWLKPKMNFKAVIEKYGYPVVSKRIAQYVHEVRHSKSVTATVVLRLTGYRDGGRKMSPSSRISQKWLGLIKAPFDTSDKCCDVMKKEPFGRFVKESGRYPINGVRAEEGERRQQTYCTYGCNAFGLNEPRSTPLAFWLDKDINDYFKEKVIPWAKVYDMGYKRTGCMFCMFGCHLEGSPNRFQRMKETHPKQWKYCMDVLGLREVLKFIGVDPEPRKYFWEK